MEGLNSIDFYEVKDPCPELQLDEITPISRRIFSLMCRSKSHPLLKQHFFEVNGAIEMVEALDYHYEAFITHKKRILQNGEESHKPLRYEAIAYVNRLGQFYYFYTSKLCSPLGDKYNPSLFVTITKKFRMKNTAHRSIDQPRGESIEDKLAHALAFSGTVLVGTSIGAPPLTHEERWTKMKVAFLSNQIDPSDCVRLVLEDDHNTIMNELFSFFSDLLS